MGLVTSCLAYLGANCCCRLGSCALSGCMGAADGADGDEEMGYSRGPTTLSKIVRFKYALFLLVGFVAAVLLKDGVGGFLAKGSLAVGCKMSSMQDLCYGHTYVYRITFTLVVFYLLHMCTGFSCGDDDGRMRYKLQTRFWIAKIFLFLVIFIISLFIHNGFWNYYAYVCFVAAAVFIVMQILILIDFAYDWNESWTNQDDLEGDDSNYGYYLLGTTAIMYIGGTVFLVFMFHWFTGEGCDRNMTFLLITAICGFIYTAIAIRLEHTSILTSGVVYVYTIAVCFSAIRSGATKECNLLWSDDSNTGLNVNIALSSAFALLSLLYSCFSTTNSRSTFSTGEDDGESGAADYGFFHFVMMLGSAYMAVVLTGWSLTETSGDQTGDVLIHSVGAMWFKMVSQWLAIALFVWTQFAPLIHPDREYD
eukprot:TRINITY_DN66622_c0_g1_i1.p1 TRINITY_DN66622_c0_g1~~TRINITY_DN66622_c0_g1_i1.p1  ORF type:complete len:422 (-),score=18.80 TRINITY_DN66622_c0_g1_i1:832-2097(-)